MASRLQQLLSRAKTVVDPLYSTLRSQTVKQYDSLMAKNAQYVVKDPAAEEKLLRQWFFSKMARIPSGIAHAEQEAGTLRQRLANFRDMPVPEMAVYVGFAAELYAWFVIGEIVGRGGSLTGYNA